MTEDAPLEQRGIHNPSIVDLITVDPDRDEVVLVMLQRRPWREDASQISELQDKFNSYFDYVVMGHLVQQYPRYSEMRVRLQLEYSEAPPAALEPTLAEAERIGRRHRIGLAVVPQPEGREAPWER